MTEAERKPAGSLDRAAAAVARINRRHLAWGAIVLGAIILLSVNLIASSALRDARFDLTQDGLFTISEGTRKALSAIDEPIDIKVYFSKKLGEAAPTYAKSFERVRTMLEQYRGISGGKLHVTFLEPEPFSDAEDKAVAAGLKGVRLNQEGEMGYFGIVGSNSTDTEANLPFLAAERERFLEYDVTKMIVTLANQAKSTIGLISTIPIEGSPGMPMMGQPGTPALLMLQQIREFFEIKSLPKDAKEIPSDVGVLMLVQPDGLSAETAYAIDQFALAGGKVLALVDPAAETQRQGNPMMMMPQPAPDFAEFGKLLKAWGIDFDAGKVAGDIARARRVQFGGGPRSSVTEYVLWLGLDRRNLDERDPLAANIERLNFASVGILSKAADAKTEFTPLVRTTLEAMEIPTESVSMMPDAVGLLRGYKRGGKALTLAARVSGEAKTAFPGGRPPAAPEPKKEGDAAKKDTPPPSDKKADAPARPQVTDGKVNVVIIADTDFMQDQFWVDVREFLGQQVAVPNAHNGAFVLAALENLSGTDALISLRARGVTDRPFELVDDLRRDAEQRFRNKEQELTARLRDVQTKLASLEKEGTGDSVTLTDPERQEIEKFRGDMLSIRRDLREVKRELRKDIDRLGGVLKFANIAAVPLLIGIAGIAWAYRRRRIVAPKAPPAASTDAEPRP
jgi:ABC-type uncharacterized transport system involved in gliding motility auxiliary subunit